MTANACERRCFFPARIAANLPPNTPDAGSAYGSLIRRPASWSAFTNGPARAVRYIQGCARIRCHGSVPNMRASALLGLLLLSACATARPPPSPQQVAASHLDAATRYCEAVRGNDQCVAYEVGIYNRLHPAALVDQDNLDEILLAARRCTEAGWSYDGDLLNYLTCFGDQRSQITASKTRNRASIAALLGGMADGMGAMSNSYGAAASAPRPTPIPTPIRCQNFGGIVRCM